MPIITIFGATGTQGRAVLNAVLADGTYTPRAVSRSVDSSGSKALIAKGVEVVKGNLWDKESLKDAIRGSEAVFRGKGKITQGKNLVDAAKEVGVKFFIWSSLPDATKESNGLYSHIYHIDNKVVIQDYLKASGVPYAVLLTGWFIDNLWNFGSLQKTDTGYTIKIPKYGPEDMQSATWARHDLGAAVVALLRNYADLTKGVRTPCWQRPLQRVTLGKEVTFTSAETSGFVELDEMVCVALLAIAVDIGMYTDTPVPNPELVALGVKFGSIEEFIKTEVVPRFA
ncbi:hypothetical protein C8R44DRAFT_834198 [Mycena epipterygia]|nr:hypothetical protein C8R44DRAFT_834198 [Mycena epipterygia]